MAKFGKGPFIDITENKAWELGNGRCDCGQMNMIKVNVSGSPYRHCYGEHGCGCEDVARGIGHARRLVLRVEKWGRKCTKRQAFILLGLIDSDADIDEGEKIEPEKVEVETPLKDKDLVGDILAKKAEKKSEKKPFFEFTFFGKEL